MEVLQNPFWLIGAHEFTSRDEINDLVEQQSLILEENVCNEARLVLLTPRRRLEAEVGWIFALPVGDKPYLPATLDPQLQAQLQSQQELIVQFLQAAQEWKEAHASSALTSHLNSQHAYGVSFKDQLAQAVQFNPQASSAGDLQSSQPVIFPLNVSFTWQDLKRQEADALSIKVRTLGHQVLQQLAQVANGYGALSVLNVLSLMLECTEFYPGDLMPSHVMVNSDAAVPLASDLSFNNARNNSLNSSCDEPYESDAELNEDGTECKAKSTGVLKIEYLASNANAFDLLWQGAFQCLAGDGSGNGLGGVKSSVNSKSGLGDYLWLMVKALSQLNVPKIITVINLARKQAKVPLVSDLTALEDALSERKHQILHGITTKLSTLTQSELAVYLTNMLTFVQHQDLQLARNSELLHELFDLYEMQSRELFLRQLSWKTQVLPMFGTLPEEIYRLEVPFETLRLAWLLDEAPWRIDLAMQDVFTSSRLWMQRQRPIVMWYLLQERDVKEIKAVATLAELWQALLKVLRNPLRTFYRGDDIACYCWELFKGCGAYEQEFHDNLRRLAESEGPFDKGKLSKGCLEATATAWTRERKVSATKAQWSDDRDGREWREGNGGFEYGNWQQCELRLFDAILQVDEKEIPWADIEVMRYAMDDDFEIVELYSAQGHLLAEIAAKETQLFNRITQALAEHLSEVKFKLKFELSVSLGRELHFGRLHVRWDQEAVIYSEQDLETERVYDLRKGHLVMQDITTLSYRRSELAESEEFWSFSEHQPLDSTIATFREFDNLPLLLNFIVDRWSKQQLNDNPHFQKLRLLLGKPEPNYFGILKSKTQSQSFLDEILRDS